MMIEISLVEWNWRGREREREMQAELESFSTLIGKISIEIRTPKLPLSSFPFRRSIVYQRGAKWV